MDYSCIHIFGHIISEEIIKAIETQENYAGNTERDFAIPTGMSVRQTIDSEWSMFKMRWLNVFNNRNLTNDPYGTKSVKSLMKLFFTEFGYDLLELRKNVEVENKSYGITYLASECGNLPIIVVGDVILDNTGIQTHDKCSLDFRAKGQRTVKSPHATMLEYLNVTDNIYGIVSNGRVLRVIRNSGELVKTTYIEFDLQKMVEEDHYNEFVIMFRLIHNSRFVKNGDDSTIFERYFNQSVESGNRIRFGLSVAAQNVMEIIGTAALKNTPEVCDAYEKGELTAPQLHKELIHFIYKLLFLFIVEDRNLLYAQDEDADEQIDNWNRIYNKYYSVRRLRTMSEYPYLKKGQYYDMWMSLFETFRLFEDESFGAPLGLKPLGSVLFATNSTPWLRKCKIDNYSLLTAFGYLDQFQGEQGNMVKINYTALDVEEFGSVYEGILELRPIISLTDRRFYYAQGLDRKTTSSYYTRPDLVNSLIKTTLVPVIEEKLKACKAQEDRIKMLLDLKVCDAASGSGHFVLAMARTIAWYLCVARTGEDNPASKDYHEALREVIQKCVYAVDYNPDAVELCKVVLWIEGYCAGKPLSFLDHHIRCGNSVVGVTDLNVLLEELPKDAFRFSVPDDNPEATLKYLKDLVKKCNKDEALANKNGEYKLFGGDTLKLDESQVDLSNKAKEIAAMPETSLNEESEKQVRWEAFMQSPQVECLRRACDIYTYAFYYNYTYDDFFNHFERPDSPGNKPKALIEVPLPGTINKALCEADPKYHGEKLSEDFKSEVQLAADRYGYFHWSVEFPEVFSRGGFDVMCGNPPWDKIQMEEEKWFAGKDEKIAKAPNQNKRHKLIEQLAIDNPELYFEFIEDSNNIAKQVDYIKNSDRFKLTSKGKLDYYPLFAEHCFNCTREAWGLVIPTGIATADTNKDFFSKLVDENRLISLYDFENKEGLFDIHRMTKFCLFTVGKAQIKPRLAMGGFFLTRLEHILDQNRIYSLEPESFSLLNPNTKTCALCRTPKDLQITEKIYRNSTILLKENPEDNPWKVDFKSMLNMSTDSKLFYTYSQLVKTRYVYENGCFYNGNQKFIPLCEGKMIWHYNHHFGIWPTEGKRPETIDMPQLEDLQDTNSITVPWYWVSENVVNDKLMKTDRKGNLIWKWEHRWCIAYRCITNATNERTFVATILPSDMGIGHSLTILYNNIGVLQSAILVGLMNSLVFDFCSRQKMGGSNMSTFFVKQFPVLTPEQIPSSLMMPIVSRVAKLCYFNHDLDGWAEELWNEMTPEQRKEIPQLGRKECFIYDPDKRAVWQAELDAIFAHLYGLTTEDLRYILDPEDVCGVGCINETFRVLKDNEIREFSEYRTKRLVLKAWKDFGYEN